MVLVSFSFNFKENSYFICVCVCLWHGALRSMAWHASTNQRTTLWSRFSPTFTWVLRIRLWSPGLYSEHLYLLSHLSILSWYLSLCFHLSFYLGYFPHCREYTGTQTHTRHRQTHIHHNSVSQCLFLFLLAMTYLSHFMKSGACFLLLMTCSLASSIWCLHLLDKRSVNIC